MLRSRIPLALLVISLLPATAQAAEVPCPDSEEQFRTSVPAFSRVGGSDTFRVTFDDSDGYYFDDYVPPQNFTLMLKAQDGTAKVTPVLVDEEGSARLILAVPTSGDSYRAEFTWDQGVGSQAECRGSDSYTIRLAGANGTVGEPRAPRLSGAYRVTYRPVNYPGKLDKSAWTIKPQCDFFGCSSRLSSTGGLSGLLKLRDRQTYRLDDRPQSGGWCEVELARVNTLTGETVSRRLVRIKPAYRNYKRVTLTSFETAPNGRVTAFAGKVRYWTVRTPRAVQYRCRAYPKVEVDSIRGEGL